MRHVVSTLLGVVAASVVSAQVGEEPAVREHLDQAAIEAGQVSLDKLFEHGQLLFDARFNALDGQGRPATTGGGAPRQPGQPPFIRTSAPDAISCAGCHAQPRSGGAGDFVANVFVLAQTLDPVIDSVDAHFSNERNTLGMMGAGPIEMLAREMTAELHAIRDEARAAAAASGQEQTRPLIAKGVSFGTLRVLPDGRIDPSGIDGVDWDLIIKPFHQKGAVVSLREFTNNAMNHHHGMQSVERFGLDVDADGDGVVNELSVGDITAATVFQAMLNAPGQVIPMPTKAECEEGELLFSTIGCASCHIPSLELSSRFFMEPNPYNPPGNLRETEVSRILVFDMTRDGPGPHIERTAGGGAIVRAFTDLKRHNLNDEELNFFANEKVPQGRLNGFAPASEFTIEPPPRPTEEFLTRKLWDVGNTSPYGHRGDLTTITDAIYYHGGDARASRDAFFALPQEDQDKIVEFLRTLQVVPDGAERLTYVQGEQIEVMTIPEDALMQCGPFGLIPLSMMALAMISTRAVVRRRRA